MFYTKSFTMTSFTNLQKKKISNTTKRDIVGGCSLCSDWKSTASGYCPRRGTYTVTCYATTSTGARSQAITRLRAKCGAIRSYTIRTSPIAPTTLFGCR